MPKYALVMDVPDDVDAESMRETVRMLLADELGQHEVEPGVIYGEDVEAQVLDSLSIAEQ